MRTDGLNAFDSETRAYLNRLLLPKERKREREKRAYRKRAKAPKPPKAAKPPRPPKQAKTREPGKLRTAAIAYLEHKAQGGTTTQIAWAAQHGISQGGLAWGLAYLRDPQRFVEKKRRWKASLLAQAA